MNRYVSTHYCSSVNIIRHFCFRFSVKFAYSAFLAELPSHTTVSNPSQPLTNAHNRPCIYTVIFRLTPVPSFCFEFSNVSVVLSIYIAISEPPLPPTSFPYITSTAAQFVLQLRVTLELVCMCRHRQHHHHHHPNKQQK